MSDPVDALMAVEEGQQVRLESRQYEFKSPFDVTAIEEETWTAATGDTWDARTVRLEPGHHAANTREFTVVEGGSPPNLGDFHGKLVAVTPVGDEQEEDDEPEDPDPDGGLGLPDGVSEDDVRQAAREHQRLGDVAAEIGVTRGRARTVTVALGLYGDLRDVPRGGRA